MSGQPKLTAQAVIDLIEDCLFMLDEPTENAVIAEGITTTFGFHPSRLSQHADDIAALLKELPEPFHSTTGGGWTFLNVCQDRNGNQWTDLHRLAECLICLGIATQKAHWTVPRGLWPVLPGKVPYVTIL